MPTEKKSKPRFGWGENRVNPVGRSQFRGVENEPGSGSKSDASGGRSVSPARTGLANPVTSLEEIEMVQDAVKRQAQSQSDHRGV